MALVALANGLLRLHFSLPHLPAWLPVITVSEYLRLHDFGAYKDICAPGQSLQPRCSLCIASLTSRLYYGTLIPPPDDSSLDPHSCTFLACGFTVGGTHRCGR